MMTSRMNATFDNFLWQVLLLVDDDFPILMLAFQRSNFPPVDIHFIIRQASRWPSAFVLAGFWTWTICIAYFIASLPEFPCVVLLANERGKLIPHSHSPNRAERHSAIILQLVPPIVIVSKTHSYRFCLLSWRRLSKTGSLHFATLSEYVLSATPHRTMK